MNELKQLVSYIDQIYNLSTNLDLINTFNDLVQENTKLKQRNLILEKQNSELNFEITNLNKVSLIQNLSKQLNEKDKYILILESKLANLNDKLINSNPSSPLQISNKEPVIIHSESLEFDSNQKYLETIPELPEPVKSVENVSPIDSEPESENEINDIDNYEVLMYKGQYYYRDLETNEIYDIYKSKPNNIVGYLNEKGKLKFTK